MTIYLDFDGTVVEHEYPEIGRCNFGCIEVIDKLQKAGHTILLNTMRCEFNDGSLEKALKWFNNAYMFLKKRDLAFDLQPIKHTDRKFDTGYWDWEYFKENDFIVIDDQTRGIPLKCACMASGYMVDWEEVDKQLKEHKIY